MIEKIGSLDGFVTESKHFVIMECYTKIFLGIKKPPKKTTFNFTSLYSESFILNF